MLARYDILKADHSAGGRELNNLFSSEEALNRWWERYPELKGRPSGTVAQALERARVRQQGR